MPRAEAAGRTDRRPGPRARPRARAGPPRGPAGPGREAAVARGVPSSGICAGGRAARRLLFDAGRRRGGVRAARQRQDHADAPRRHRPPHRLPGHPDRLAAPAARHLRTPSTARSTRTAHFARTWRALRSGDEPRRARLRHAGLGAALAGPRAPRRRGRALHLVVLDVPAGTALEGQGERGRWVSGVRLRPAPRRGPPPDRPVRGRAAADRLRHRRCCWTGTRRRRCDRIGFTEEARGGPGAPAPSGPFPRPARPLGRARPHGRHRRQSDSGRRTAHELSGAGVRASARRRRLAGQRARRGAGRGSLGARRTRARGSSRCWAAARSGCRCPTAAARTAPTSTCPPWRSTAPPTSRSTAPSSSSSSASAPTCRSRWRPAVEFARGLPPQLGIAVNPEGAVGMPLPPPAVAELCRTGPYRPRRTRVRRPGTPLRAGLAGGPGRLPRRRRRGVRGDRAWCSRARRALASIEGESPALFIGVEFSTWDGGGPQRPDGGARPRAAAGSRSAGRSTWSCWM